MFAYVKKSILSTSDPARLFNYWQINGIKTWKNVDRVSGERCGRRGLSRTALNLTPQCPGQSSTWFSAIGTALCLTRRCPGQLSPWLSPFRASVLYTINLRHLIILNLQQQWALSGTAQSRAERFWNSAESKLRAEQDLDSDDLDSDDLDSAWVTGCSVHFLYFYVWSWQTLLTKFNSFCNNKNVTVLIPKTFPIL